jgi:hypothetical protein
LRSMGAFYRVESINNDEIRSLEKRTRGIKRIDLAYVELASSENALKINRDIVLEIIRSKLVARADLARPSGLQASNNSAIAEQLIEEKWVSEGNVEGRPREGEPCSGAGMRFRERWA